MTEIKDNFEHRINPVSINLTTLEFLKEFIDNNEVSSILEFGSGVSTEFWSEQLSQAHVIPTKIVGDIEKLLPLESTN